MVIFGFFVHLIYLGFAILLTMFINAYIEIVKKKKVCSAFDNIMCHPCGQNECCGGPIQAVSVLNIILVLVSYIVYCNNDTWLYVILYPSMVFGIIILSFAIWLCIVCFRFIYKMILIGLSKYFLDNT